MAADQMIDLLSLDQDIPNIDKAESKTKTGKTKKTTTRKSSENVEESVDLGNLWAETVDYDAEFDVERFLEDL